MNRFVNIDLSFLKQNKIFLVKKMKKIKKINNLEDFKMDLSNLEDVEIIILPKKRLLKWFQSMEKEN